MKALHIVTVLGVIAVGFVVKQAIFSVNKVTADVRPAVAMDILQMHRRLTGQLPVQAMRDMTFVFDAAGH